MTQMIVLASTLLAVALTAALVRQWRMRRALERLLTRLVTFLRNEHANDPPPHAMDAAGDDSAARDRRL